MQTTRYMYRPAKIDHQYGENEIMKSRHELGMVLEILLLSHNHLRRCASSTRPDSTTVYGRDIQRGRAAHDAAANRNGETIVVIRPGRRGTGKLGKVALGMAVLFLYHW